MVWMHLRSSNLIRQLLGDDPRPTRRPWRSPYFGWRARPPALIRTRSPGASDCLDSVSVFVAEPMPLHSFTLHHHAGNTPMEVGWQLCELPSLSLFGGFE